MGNNDAALTLWRYMKTDNTGACFNWLLATACTQLGENAINHTEENTDSRGSQHNGRGHRCGGTCRHRPDQGEGSLTLLQRALISSLYNSQRRRRSCRAALHKSFYTIRKNFRLISLHFLTSFPASAHLTAPGQASFVPRRASGRKSS